MSHLLQTYLKEDPPVNQQPPLPMSFFRGFGMHAIHTSYATMLSHQYVDPKDIQKMGDGYQMYS
jgi:hypothetical protein